MKINIVDEYIDYEISDIGSKSFAVYDSMKDSLCAALELLKIAKGSRIGLPAISYDYVNAAIIKSGYVPIFIDIVPQTGLIDINKIHSANVICVIPVHLFGQCCNIYKILELGVLVIEDCSHSIGGVISGQHIGTIGSFGIFIYQRDKSLLVSGWASSPALTNPKIQKRIELANKFENQIHLPRRSQLGLDVYTVLYTLVENKNMFINFMKQNGIEVHSFKCDNAKQQPLANIFCSKCVRLPLACVDYVSEIINEV